jgi:hypothetical protein
MNTFNEIRPKKIARIIAMRQSYLASSTVTKCVLDGDH